MQLNLIIPVPPSINHLYVNQYSWNKDKNGKAIRIPTGKRILSKEGEQYKENTKKLVIKQMENQRWDYNETSEKYLYIDYIAYMNRKGRDSDNLHKLLQDTLKEIVYVDDSRVLTRPNRILIDRENPRLELTIKFVEWTGVFNNENELESQMLICKDCKRFKSGSCSIIKDCLDGVVNENFDYINLKCLKCKNNK